MSVLALTIALNAAVSNEFGLQDRNYGLGLICPNDWTAADITFEVSHNGTNWYLLKNESGVVRITSIATSGGFAVSLNAMNSVIPFPKIRLKSTNTASEAAVNQAAARTVYLYTVDVK